jgi:hypothetical protein
VTAGRLWTTFCNPDLVTDVHFVKIGMPAQLFVKLFKINFAQFSFAVLQLCDVQRDGQSDVNRCSAKMATR